MFEDRVSRGVAVLDAAIPDWRSQIDVEMLDMASSRNCVLGQLYGSFSNGVDELGLGLFPENDENPRDLGFDFYYEDPDCYRHEELTEAWHAVL